MPLTKLKIEKATFKDLSSSKDEAAPGEEVELQVTAENLPSGQKVQFELRDSAGFLGTLEPTASGTTYKRKWNVPNGPGDFWIKYAAVLRETPSPKNGHLTIVRRLPEKTITVHGVQLSISKADEAFVPKAEKLELEWRLTDGNASAKKGRYEVWGERYPSNKPVYTSAVFTPADGDTTWNAWDGKANDGVLNNKWITPEFSPYRVRVVVGPDEDSVKDPSGKGKGKVGIAETSFAIRFESIRIRVQTGLEASVEKALKECLKIVENDGSFSAEGRLPKPATDSTEAENGRIRIPCVRHYSNTADSLSQGKAGGKHTVAAGYLESGGTKWANDDAKYTRPEIPLEFEPRLKSRDSDKNKDPEFGVFEKEAVGALKIDVIASEHYPEALFTTVNPAAHRTYFERAFHSVKAGTHDAPQESGGNPKTQCWQQRFVVPADNTQEFTFTRPYTTTKKELVVYLNRTRLELGADKDYTEVSTTKIKLKKDLTKAKDVLWVMFKAYWSSTSGADIPKWASFPPGVNCHDHYGGIRGKSPNAMLADKFSTKRVGHEDIIGKGTKAFPYADKVKLDPDKATDDRERVETEALDSGNEKGLAGIIFSPSYIGGDNYVIGGRLTATAYDRNLGYHARKPLEAKTGPMTVWRVSTITQSWRLAQEGTPGLKAGVGVDDSGETSPDGQGMSVSNMRACLENACNEWVVLENPDKALANMHEVHRNVNLGTFRTQHNAEAPAILGDGNYILNSDLLITNNIIHWDVYVTRLPPGIPDDRQDAVSAIIKALPPASTAEAARDAALAELVTPTLPDGNGGPGAIDIEAGSVSEYQAWAKGLGKKLMKKIFNTIIPQEDPPRTMNLVRWPEFLRLWINGNAGVMAGGGGIGSTGLAGTCMGNRQAFFASVGGNADTFEHEMGHSINLCHFVTSGGNLGNAWKHHDHGYPKCKMGYNNKGPYTVPNVLPAITLSTGSRDQFCAKCLLKVRGWKEDVLPCNWTHKAVF